MKVLAAQQLQNVSAGAIMGGVLAGLGLYFVLGSLAGAASKVRHQITTASPNAKSLNRS